jgi:hypothetical protein
MPEKEHPSSEVLKRIEELNRKIAEIRHAGDIQDLRVVKRQTDFSLDYLDSDNLYEIERGIQETMDGLVLSKVVLCKALANIDRKKLYTQVGAGNFHEYLQLERIPLNYKTAKEYAKIGDTLIRHASELEAVDFHEEDGLKKMVYLDKALDTCNAEREEIFQKVKESSLRDFQRWITTMKRVEERPFDETDTVDQGGVPSVDFFWQEGTLYERTSAGGGKPVCTFYPHHFTLNLSSEEIRYCKQRLKELAAELLTQFYRDRIEGGKFENEE